MVSGRPTVTVKMTADDRELDQELDGVESKLGSFATKGAAVLALVAAGFTTIVASARKAMDVLDEWEKKTNIQVNAEKRLRAALRATGGAVGQSAEELITYAGELQNLTNFGDEETIGMMAKLATFNKITGDTFNRATRAAQDLAAAGFGTLDSAAIQLAKALQDPVKGMNAMARSGVSFSQAEQQLIKDLVEANRLLEAQDIILTAVEGQVGGTAEATVRAGQQMENAWGDVQEKIGEVWKAFKEPFIDEALNQLNELNEALAETQVSANQAGEAIGVTLVEDIKSLAATIEAIPQRDLEQILMIMNPALGVAAQLGRPGGEEGFIGRFEANLRRIRTRDLADAAQEAATNAPGTPAEAIQMRSAFIGMLPAREDWFPNADITPGVMSGVQTPVFQLDPQDPFNARLESLTQLNRRITQAAASDPALDEAKKQTKLLDDIRGINREMLNIGAGTTEFM